MTQEIRYPWPQIDGIASTLIDQMGRIKSDRQRLMDANRQNSHSDIARNNPADRDRTNAIVGRRLTKRSQ